MEKEMKKMPGKMPKKTGMPMEKCEMGGEMGFGKEKGKGKP